MANGVDDSQFRGAEDDLRDIKADAEHAFMTDVWQILNQQQTVIETLRDEVLGFVNASRNPAPSAPNPNQSNNNPFLPTFTSTPSAPHQPPQAGTFIPKRSAIRPSDIPVVNLTDLDGIETESTLAELFGLVESCVSSDEERLQVAQTRVDKPLHAMIYSLIKQGKISTWCDFKAVLSAKFCGTPNITEAWQIIEEITYDIEESPRTFVNRLNCKVAALETKFPKESIPEAEKLTKRKLFQGLPEVAQRKLGDFFDTVSLTEFLKRVEDERRLVLLTNRDIKRVSARKDVASVTPSKPPESRPPSTDRFDKLERALNNLTQQMKSFKPPPKKMYCGYCAKTDHTPATCPLKPERNACFDCLRVGCKKGNADCPGRQSRQSK